MTCSLPEHHYFAHIEQLDEFFGALNWSIEYRQLQPGRLSSNVSLLEGDSWFLAKEQSNRNIEGQSAAPLGMYVLALIKGNPAVVNGQTVSSGHVFFQSPESDFRVTLPAGIEITQVGVTAAQFEDTCLATQGHLPNLSGALSLPSEMPGQLALVLQTMKEALFDPTIGYVGREERVSRAVAELITIAHRQLEAPKSHRLNSAQARKTLERARDYIEANLGDTIRISFLCQYAGTTARSLERVFARELGTSPQLYIKARRLNAVRRNLLAADRVRRAVVTEVAQSFGFTHMGRFAQEYRLYFGESPRETLLSN